MASGRTPKPGITPFRFAMIGSELVAFTLFGVLIDWLTGWLPWATVGMTILGLVAVMLHLGQAVLAKNGDVPDQLGGSKGPAE